MATSTRRKPTTRRAAPKVDAYQLVTDSIIEALEAGFVPWHRPWRADTTARPMSLSTRKPYSGINVFLLGVTAHLRGYESQWWGTYKQIAERGGQVRKGEKGTQIVFWRFYEPTDKASKEKTGEKIPVLRYFTVFNADQCDDVKVPATEPLADHEPIAACEQIANGYIERSEGLTLKVGGDVAAYWPAGDQLMMPKLGQFETPEHYYGALFHEMGHSTGHKSRLNRKGIEDHAAVFGTEEYSREELIAEMTAAFVCGDAGIDVNVPHRTGYIACWLRALRDEDNKKLVVAAGGAAQRAANLILDRNPAVEEDEGQEV